MLFYIDLQVQVDASLSRGPFAWAPLSGSGAEGWPRVLCYATAASVGDLHNIGQNSMLFKKWHGSKSGKKASGSKKKLVKIIYIILVKKFCWVSLVNFFGPLSRMKKVVFLPVWGQ